MNWYPFSIEGIVELKRCAGALSIVLFGFAGATTLGACGEGESDAGPQGPEVDPAAPLGESLLAIKGPFKPDPKRSPEPRGPQLIAQSEPVECSDKFKATPCMRYYLPLLGNPHQNEALAAKYKAAFGDACYKSDVPSPTFNCFYNKADVVGTATKEGKACTDAKMIATIFGASPYANQYKCQPSGSDFSLQVGPDVMNVIYIRYGEAPLETSLIDVDGVPTEINGPYRNLPEPPNVKVGGDFHCASGQGPNLTQWDMILATNRKAHGGVIHSDFAGFTWPCNEPGKPICTEETVLIRGSSDLAKAVEVHHEVRRKDRRGCDWGTNSNSNAVVISRKLNRFFWYKYPSAQEVNWVNQIPPYTP